MPLDITRTRNHLREFDFKTLFVEDLGWNHYSTELNISVDDRSFTLVAIAEKCGMVAFVCVSPVNDRIPEYQTRRKIEQQTAKSAHEHLIIYVDSPPTTQIWQWVKRESGKPVACREHQYHYQQPGDALIQKLQDLVFTLEEEGALTIVDVAGRARSAFDVERVTKKFYDQFKTEHADFLKFIQGIPDEELERWYASVMLNRLMFIYFIQKKGFLDNDPDYLRHKLLQSKQKGTDCFYPDFLSPLFFKGFAQKEAERMPETNRLLGKIPYLNGGLFLRHQIEELHGKTICIPDAAFEKLFDFFEQYQWHLDERPVRSDKEINPDVLGYIFEKYINQKQMGAYYTKEDITGYIGKNTIIPFIVDSARAKCKIAFDGEHNVWNLLESDPDRYIYPALQKGGRLDLPQDIAVGLSDVSKRTEWNKPALEEYALPTETWREVVARQKRYQEVSAKLAKGEIHDINDFITYNLDIRQFAQDVIENSEGPELLRAFYHAIEQVKILDPTCGSGAFLFAALNILEPLYEACLDRMQVFLDELERSGEKHRPEKFSDLRKVLEKVAEHPNRRYFILKSIIVNNLYGVDIMEEAIEICKLRLFLKLVAQVERVERIEPLPDIDFNIRTGNTLIGFATYDEIRKTVTGKLDFDNTMDRIEEKVQDIERLSDLFRQQQTELGGEVTPADKKALRDRLKKLEDELNRYLAIEYSINRETISDKEIYAKRFTKWQGSHQPFHWYSEFHGILSQGGFDVILGNPPYVEYNKVRNEYTVRGYETESCGNLYAFILERSFRMLRMDGRNGMIVQLPIVCTDRMEPLQKECLERNKSLWFATFDDRPARLFDGLEHIRACIVIAQKGKTVGKNVFTTNYNRWYSESRDTLFEFLSFAQVSEYLIAGAIPKIGDLVAKAIRKCLDGFTALGIYLIKSGNHKVYFHNSPQYWVRAMNFVPYFWNERDGEQISTQVKVFYTKEKVDASVLVAVMNSSLFYWWFITLSDCRHLNLREIERFPIGLDLMPKTIKNRLSKLTDTLMADLKKNAYRKEACYQTTGKVVYDEFYPKYSKPIIDEIDRVLARHYGFTDEELDFIINYDIKYRMGKDNSEEAE